MKKQLLFVLGMVLLVGSGAAFAQSVHMKADVPFGFIAEKQVLPAGEYTIVNMDMAGQTLAIRSDDGKQLTMVGSIPCQKLDAAKDTKLVFHRYGDKYFLSQIWVAGHNTGHELTRSRQEIEVARNSNQREVNVTASLQ